MKAKAIVRRSIAVIAIAAMGITIMPSINADAAATAKLSKTKLSIYTGSSKTLKVTGKGIKKVTWKSTKTKIASVTGKSKTSAKVKAKKKGTAKIKAMVKFSNGKKKTLSCNLTVKTKKDDSTKTPAATPTATAVVTVTAAATPTNQPSTAAPTPTSISTAVPTPEGPTPTPKLDENNLVSAGYPTIASDVPDNDIIRVGGEYYMVSTTMNLCPGVPIMKSTDLVHWQIVNYVYNSIAEDDDRANLENGQQMYKNGSWAAAIRYDETEGLYYVCFNSNTTGKFYIYTTKDIENGEWTQYIYNGGFHDPGLWVEDGKIYVVTNTNLSQIELNDDYTISKVGETKKLFTSQNSWSLCEGSHIYKHGDYYYITMIGSMTTGWFRMETCFRNKDLTSTDGWEEQIIFRGSTYEYGSGLGQGGFVDTIYDDWYGFLFQDHDGLGRVPSIVAVDWNVPGYEDWPMMGTTDSDGKFVMCNPEDNSFKITEPLKIRLNDSGESNFITSDDEFNYTDGQKLNLAWQWNHNPDNDNWSVTANPGYYRITNGRTCNNIWFARNSLTQRTIGPKFTSETAILTSGMKAGDYAGIATISKDYAMIGVKCDENGDRYLFQGSGDGSNGGAKASPDAKIIENAVGNKIEGDTKVYLKIEYSFNSGNSRSDKANFYYSLDGTTWNKLGKELSLGFETSTTFMGSRTWLSSYATSEAGGYVDFDYYKQSQPE